MKVLVTGGAGFIGSNIIKLLSFESAQITVLDNFSTGYEENLKPFTQVKVIRGDIRDSQAVAEAIKGAEVVFHLAASIGNVKSLEDPIFDSDVNVLGTLNVLEAARKSGVKKIVYSSSAAIYGEPKKMPIDEEHPVAPDSFYGVSKLAGEKHCLCAAKIYDLEIIALRYFNVYGLNQRYDAYGNVIPIFTTRLFKNQPLIIYGDGEQTRDFVNVTDIARANILAAKSYGLSGAFNIGSGKSLTVNELASLIQETSGISTQINHVPERKGEVKHSLADVSLAKQALGYEPSICAKEGLKEYVAWMKKQSLGAKPW